MDWINLHDPDLLVWYKVFRVGFLAVVLYFIIWYVYFSKRSKQMEEPAKKILEED